MEKKVNLVEISKEARAKGKVHYFTFLTAKNEGIDPASLEEKERQTLKKADQTWREYVEYVRRDDVNGGGGA